MKKKIVALVVAAVLAMLGVVVMIGWASAANDRAFEGAELVSVVRVTERVAAGADAADIASKVEIAELPKTAVPAGAVRAVADIAGLSSNAQLEPGEVLLESRLTKPGQATAAEGDVPKGMQEVTVPLTTERVVGGEIKKGDTVGVIGSIPAEGAAPNTSRMIAARVLVTKVQAGVADDATGGSLVTLAVSTSDAEKIVFSMEFGKVWLTLQPSDVETGGSSTVTKKDVNP